MTTDDRPASLEPLQECVFSQLPDIEGPNADYVRRLVYDTALIAYELGWNVAHSPECREDAP